MNTDYQIHRDRFSLILKRFRGSFFSYTIFYEQIWNLLQQSLKKTEIFRLCCAKAIFRFLNRSIIQPYRFCMLLLLSDAEAVMYLHGQRTEVPRRAEPAECLPALHRPV